MQTIPKGRPNPLVDELATLMLERKAVESKYKFIVDKLKSTKRLSIAGIRSIVYFKEVPRKSIDIELLTEEEQYIYERLKSKATVTSVSLSLSKVSPK